MTMVKTTQEYKFVSLLDNKQVISHHLQEDTMTSRLTDYFFISEVSHSPAGTISDVSHSPAATISDVSHSPAGTIPTNIFWSCGVGLPGGSGGIVAAGVAA